MKQAARKYYKSETNPKGWNNIHANLLLDIPNQVFVDCYVGAGDSRRSHDEQGALFSLRALRPVRDLPMEELDRDLSWTICLKQTNDAICNFDCSV